MKKLLILLPLALLAACEEETSAEYKQKLATRQLQADAEARVGMPKVTNFTEKRVANMIVELRDQPNLVTYSYVMRPGLGYCLLGKSIGYGLPYTTQITNPMQDKWGSNGGTVTLPQAEPNGLYSSETSNASWVLLIGKGGKPSPTYVESDITVRLEPMTNVSPC